MRWEKAMHGTRLLVASGALSLWAVATVAAPITPDEAASHVGQTATVCGAVASTKYDAHFRSQPTFLDFGKPYPNQVFTVVIFGSNRAKFGTPETTFQRKTRLCDRSGPQLSREARDHRERSEPANPIIQNLDRGAPGRQASPKRFDASDAWCSAGHAGADDDQGSLPGMSWRSAG
jgi:hypothetical protein